MNPPKLPAHGRGRVRRFGRAPRLLPLLATLGLGLAGTLHGQALRGVVIDDPAGEAVPWALVELQRVDQPNAANPPGRATGNRFRLVANGAGRFQLEAFPAGVYRVRVERLGFAPHIEEPRQLEPSAEQELELRVRFESIALPAGLVAGRAVDPIAGQPISGARVEVVGSGARDVTDEAGRFVLANLGEGRHLLRVEHASYRTRLDTLGVGDGMSALVVVQLTVRPVPVAPIAVQIRPAHLPGDRFGFHARQARGRGYFIDREQILEAVPSRTSDLFRSIPGLELIPTSQIINPVTGEVETLQVLIYRLRLTGAQTDCPITYYMDGLRYEPGLLDVDDVPLYELAGIEIYRRPSEIPLQFGGQRGSCGVVAFWTGVSLRDPAGAGSDELTLTHLSPGDSVRVTLLSDRLRQVDGRLERLDLEVLHVRSEGITRGLALSALAGLQTHRVQKASTGRLAVQSGLGGLLAGIAVSTIVRSDHPDLLANVAVGGALGGGFGAVIGAFVGSRRTSEEWRTVALPRIVGSPSCEPSCESPARPRP